VFFANVPVTVVALALGAAWLPCDPALAGSLSAREIARRIDLAGIAAFGGAIAALLVFLDGLPHRHWRRADIADHLHPAAPERATIVFDGHLDHHLAQRATTAPPGLRSTDERLVDLHGPVQPLAPGRIIAVR
jgi:hypothetical protein